MVATRSLVPLAAVLLGAASCGGGSTGPNVAARSYRMGFSSAPPRLDIPSVIATLEAWRPHADVAQFNLGVPWRALLADTSARTIIRREQLDLAEYYRARGLPIVVQVDATDGLAREREAPELVALGRSIAEPAVQAAYREYVHAVDSILHPVHLTLAMEVNLVRTIAPPTLYAALRTMVNGAAASLAQRGTTARLAVSVQVETAWGRLPATGSYMGIAAEEGVRRQPEDVPLDYYARLATDGGPAVPMLVLEGGWTSASVGGAGGLPAVTSSPQKQARWIHRQMQLADRASLAAVTQITFTDFDIDSYPAPPGSILPLFARLGLVDVNLQPKPALAAWDSTFARPLRVR